MSERDMENLNLDKLASLLATENITVQHDSTVTASFDLNNRVLHLPIWKNMSKELYHMLVLHEVSHALNTPQDGWKDSIEKNGSTFKSYLNVVEDARIERKIKAKYPGARRDFLIGYKEIFDNDLLGLRGRPAASMNLIDRINLFFKVGSLVEVPFSADEMKFVERTKTVMTFDDVMSLAEDIFAYAKQKSEDAKTSMQSETDELNPDGEGEEEFDEDYDFDEDESHSSDKTDDSSDKTDEDEDEDFEDAETSETSDDEDSEEDSDFSDSETAPEEANDLESKTDDALENNMREHYVDGNAKERRYFDLRDDLSYRDFLYPYKKILSDIRARREYVTSDVATYIPDSSLVEQMNRHSFENFNKFRTENVKNVSYLVREFEVKKAADQYSRARSAKTGVIDPNKIHSYKFAENVFRRNTVIPGAKNHGLVMFIDLSGSMGDNIRGTIEQLLNLVMFCRKVAIPHRVYGFQDVKPDLAKSARDELIQKIISEPLQPERDLYLMEMFHEKMNGADFNEMSRYLLDFAYEYDQQANPDYRAWRLDPSSKKEYWHDHCFWLGGTPLNSTIMLARDLVLDFRKETKAQLVNVVFLTDGGSHFMRMSSKETFGYDHREKYVNIMRDKRTKIEMIIHGSNNQTEMLNKVLAKTAGVHIINFDITTRPMPIHMISDYNDRNDAMKKFRRDKFFTTRNYMGFDDVHHILGGKHLRVESPTMDDAKDNKKGTLKRVFMKMNSARNDNRVILSRFIDRIAS